MLKPFITKIARRWVVRSQRRNQVGEFEGIRISSAYKDDLKFLEVIESALRLIKKTDPRRFSLVKKYIQVVWSVRLWNGGAEYSHYNQTCGIDFDRLIKNGDQEWWIGSCASTLIHEATHGRLCSRGIEYTPELRTRIEKLCIVEENRFLFKLIFFKPDLAESLYQHVDVTRWKPLWDATRMEQLKGLLKWW